MLINLLLRSSSKLSIISKKYICRKLHFSVEYSGRHAIAACNRAYVGPKQNYVQLIYYVNYV